MVGSWIEQWISVKFDKFEQWLEPRARSELGLTGINSSEHRLASCLRDAAHFSTAACLLIELCPESGIIRLRGRFAQARPSRRSSTGQPSALPTPALLPPPPGLGRHRRDAAERRPRRGGAIQAHACDRAHPPADPHRRRSWSRVSRTSRQAPGIVLYTLVDTRSRRSMLDEALPASSLPCVRCWSRC